jgi:hypothetical protein
MVLDEWVSRMERIGERDDICHEWRNIKVPGDLKSSQGA